MKTMNTQWEYFSTLAKTNKHSPRNYSSTFHQDAENKRFIYTDGFSLAFLKNEHIEETKTFNHTGLESDIQYPNTKPIIDKILSPDYKELKRPESLLNCLKLSATSRNFYIDIQDGFAAITTYPLQETAYNPILLRQYLKPKELQTTDMRALHFYKEELLLVIAGDLNIILCGFKPNN